MSTAEVNCVSCGGRFEVETTYFQEFGSDPYCGDCLVHTRCQTCNRGLRLQPSRYRELGGEPIVCIDCDRTETPSSSENASFWYGLTIGEKIVFPLLLLAFFALVWYYATTDASGGGLVGLLALIYWTYRRGVKNNPNRN